MYTTLYEDIGMFSNLKNRRESFIKKYCVVVCGLLIVLLHSSLFSQDQIIEPSAPDTTENPAIPQSANQSIFIPGDGLKISVYPDSTNFANGTYLIDDDGYVDFPILGLVQVTDKSNEELIKMLKGAYINYMPYPNIQIRPLIRVSVLGGFPRPGLYWVDPRENIWNIVHYAGGTMREDGLEKLLWRRNNITISKNLIPHIESGASLQTIGFKSGDQIRVTQRPQRKFWDVFRSEVLPILSFTVSTVAAASTAYIAYESFRERRE